MDKAFQGVFKKYDIHKKHQESLMQDIRAMLARRPIKVISVTLAPPNPDKGPYSENWKGYMNFSLAFPIGLNGWVELMPGLSYTILEQNLDAAVWLRALPNAGPEDNPTYNTAIRGVDIGSGIDHVVNQVYPALRKEIDGRNAALPKGMRKRYFGRMTVNEYLHYDEDKREWTLAKAETL